MTGPGVIALPWFATGSTGSTASVGVGPWGLAASGVFVAVAVVVSWQLRLGLSRAIVWAAVRAVVQLGLAGVALGIVLDRRIGWWPSWVWLAVLLVTAADAARRRAPGVPGLFGLAVLAFGVTGTAALTLLFGLHVLPLEPRTLVPSAGLLVGNSMTACALAARRTVAELRDRRDAVEMLLALGHGRRRAARPFVTRAIRDALVPQIDSTRTVGLVALPGAMTGLLLAGVAPVQAVVTQMVVMFLILGGSSLTVTVVALGVARQLVTADERLAVPA